MSEEVQMTQTVEHSELYKTMTSLAFKQDISAGRVERIGRRIASEQLESAAMLPAERGGSGRRRLQRIAYWAEWRRRFGWMDVPANEEIPNGA